MNRIQSLSQAGLGSAVLLLSLACATASPKAPVVPAASAPAPAPAAAPAAAAPAPATNASTMEAIQSTYAGRDAIKKKDYAAAVRLLEKGAQVVRDQPDVVLDLARAYALSGDKDKAIEQLDRLATLGFGDRVAKSPFFESLHGDPRFAAVEKKIAAACAPIGRSRHAFTLSEGDLLPGAMDYDAEQKLFYIGGFGKNKVVVATLDGKVSDFTASGQDGMGAVVSLRLDRWQRQLLVTSSGLGKDGKDAGIFRYDLGTRKLLQMVKYDKGGAESALVNDAIATPTGDILASEVSSGTLYRIRKGSDAMEPILPAQTFVYPNVISLAPDGRHLYVANVLGLARVDLEKRTLENMPHPAEASLVGLDGLYRDGDKFISTQNGVNPPRVIEFQLNPQGDAVIGFEVLEARTPETTFPTSGTIVGRQFYFIADSPFDELGPDGRLPNEKVRPANVRVLDLDVKK
jgi:Tetratricopeptide repeat